MTRVLLVVLLLSVMPKLSVCKPLSGKLLSLTASSLTHGDIMASQRRNADLCVKTGCKGPKAGAYVYVPIEISSDFCKRVVRFGHVYVCICWSYVGRQGEKQQISLQEDGCVYHNVVQHELLHALGFHHEQTRSDRDKYVDIHFENVKSGQESNKKLHTVNLYTPYDYNSVMQYKNHVFSTNGKPTITAMTNLNLILDYATEMSPTDIVRVNRLYRC